MFKGKEFTFADEWLRIKGLLGVVCEMSSNFAFYRDVWWGIWILFWPRVQEFWAKQSTKGRMMMGVEALYGATH